MFYWWINHPLKQFLPFAVQTGRALLRSNTSLAKAATLSWQPPVFGTGYHASAFSAGELLSCGRENLKAKSCAGVWETPGCQLLGLSFFPHCTNTSSSDLGPPWLSPCWAHFTHHPSSLCSSANKPHFSIEEPSILVLQFLLLDACPAYSIPQCYSSPDPKSVSWSQAWHESHSFFRSSF